MEARGNSTERNRKGMTRVASIRTNYEKWYAGEEYYWGTRPGDFCDALMELRPCPPAKRVLDIGCGEGKDAVYLAEQGYQVTAFDLTENGIRKAKRLAADRGVEIDAYVDDINTFEAHGQFDIVYSTGTVQYLRDENKAAFFEKVDRITRRGGIAYFNVFVQKPFLELPPDWDIEEKMWNPGELFTYLSRWKFLKIDEALFQDDSGGVPHWHCMDTVICEKVM